MILCHQKFQKLVVVDQQKQLQEQVQAVVQNLVGVVKHQVVKAQAVLNQQFLDLLLQL